MNTQNQMTISVAKKVNGRVYRCDCSTGSVHRSESSTIAAFRGEKGESQLDNEYITPELFLLLMTSLFTFYPCLLSILVYFPLSFFASVLSFFYLLYLLLTLYIPEVR